MPAPASSFARLRHSMIGAWLAVAYALAVLAASLAPQVALAHPALAHPALDGALLCSGLAAPTPDQPTPPVEVAHCKACPVSPGLAAASPVQPREMLRRAQPVALKQLPQDGIQLAPACDLPQSRAPPAA